MNIVVNKKTTFQDLGLVDYKAGWDYQTTLFNEILEIKAGNRDAGVQHPTKNFLLFCEHPHVYTLGKSGKAENLLVPADQLHTINATYYHINRGGDITYHGPGQLVAYPVIDLENFFTDIHKYLRLLEEAIILLLADYEIHAGRIPGLTGVWIDFNNPDKARKICAMGVKTSRWVTMHGLALNVNTDLNYFNHIVPCGITDKAVTSMQRETGKSQDMTKVMHSLKNKIESLFEMELV